MTSTVHILSVNVGTPREVAWQGRTVRTGIFKSPLEGPVHVGRLNVHGDAQGDQSVHGGPDKAVYVFASENYEHWRSHLARQDLSWGFFGENLTTHGLLDAEVHVGDRYRFGSAQLRVTVPRLPCSRLALRFQDESMIQRFLDRMQTGFYCAVDQEGSVQAGDDIELLASRPEGLRIPELAALKSGRSQDPELLQRAADDTMLPEPWRQAFRARLQQGT